MRTRQTYTVNEFEYKTGVNFVINPSAFAYYRIITVNVWFSTSNATIRQRSTNLFRIKKVGFNISRLVAFGYDSSTSGKVYGAFLMTQSETVGTEYKQWIAVDNNWDIPSLNQNSGARLAFTTTFSTNPT